MLKPIIAASLLAATLTTGAQSLTESRAYYSTNPNGAVGRAATITIDGEFDDWDESMLIATGGANDICTAYKGSHENCVLDTYALYAAWDDNNLYVAWQMCNTGDTWAREGDGPLTDYGRIGNVPLALCLSVNPHNPSMTGLNQYGKGLWGDKANMGYGFKGEAAHVDRWLLMSGQAGQGKPAMFVPVDAEGNSNYAEGCKEFASCGISYKMKQGFLPKQLWRQMSYADYDYSGTLLSDPSIIENSYDKEHYVDILSDYYKTEYMAEHSMKPHDTKYDSFYEIAIPFKALGVDREWIETYGICARMVATRGESGIDCIPFDPSMLDNVFKSYGADASTSHEKDDFDEITYQAASIGKMRGDISLIPEPENPPVVDPNPGPGTDPTPVPDGNWKVYLRNTASWTKPMVWIWDAGDANRNYTGGNWPGAAMKEGVFGSESLYYYSFTADKALVSPKIIFNPGSDNGKTGDLDLVNNKIYDCSGKVVGEYIQSGVDAIESDSDMPVEYYNLQGIKVSNPGRGAYIRRQGNTTTKVLIP